MGCKYVKDFDFGPQKTYVKGYARGGKCSNYAEGGEADIKQDKAMIKAAVHKHEKALHKGEPLTKMKSGGKPPITKGGAGMIPPRGALGMIANKNPGLKRGVPVAPSSPMIQPYKKGGMAKVEKVMGEFKRGELHSGSKQGPEVTSRKQAVAIAMSEAGKSKKK